MVLMEIQNLKTYYFLPDYVIKAVDGVSMKIEEGEIIGLVGESGSGKSTLGLSILKLVPPPGRIVDGHIFFEGLDLAALGEEEIEKIRGAKISMVFQDPLTSLDPLMRVGDQLVETILAHRNVSKEEAVEMAKEYLEMVGIPRDRFYDYPHQFSGGMRQRAMIAMAVSTQPKLLIADEPTTALDVIVQAQIMRLFEKLRDELNLSIILITHDISVAMEIADKIGVMYAGQLVEFASSYEIYKNPLHPYTKGLMEAVPNIELEDMKLNYIPGNPPDLFNLPSGCRFHPRDYTRGRFSKVFSGRA
ncbi:MAG: dipeptide/oligopeptide/nickel ABC transporter ATP-binding protein [Thermofilum sp. ex4484_82]|nr:MAG: dipeptide/oligopeptide/nickel ABC transporter ATP-binding protein [Thermofilum sp. ex4484_82]OYT39792.1 MAG: dipeptide/oligopeptide/nickel ABC transporter ATP-binding protein [Archaeoglobales archaeon ex4484_92]